MKDAFTYKPICNQIMTIARIRDNLKDDNDLSLKVARSGKFCMMRELDEVIETLLTLERNYLIFRNDMEIYKEACREYSDFLGGYTPDILEDERKAEVKALIEKWQKEDEEEDAM